MKVVFSRGTAEILEMCGRGLFGKINRARIEDTGEIYACMEIDYSIISTEAHKASAGNRNSSSVSSQARSALFRVSARPRG